MAQEQQQFIADVNKWFDALMPNMQAFAQACTQDICQAVVEGTPVDTGFLRGSWQPAIGYMPVGPTNGQEAATVEAVIRQLKIGQLFTLTNGAAYAMRLEYGFVGPDSLGRVYNQAGRFYMSTQLARWQEIVDHRAAQFAGAPS